MFRFHLIHYGSRFSSLNRFFSLVRVLMEFGFEGPSGCYRFALRFYQSFEVQNGLRFHKVFLIIAFTGGHVLDNKNTFFLWNYSRDHCRLVVISNSCNWVFLLIKLKDFLF